MKRLQRSRFRSESGLEGRLYPNGEVAIWKPKFFKPDAIPPKGTSERSDYVIACYRLMLACPEALAAAGVPLGLSILRNFDKDGFVKSVGDFEVYQEDVPSSEELDKDVAKVRYGAKGITRYGARMVRNGAYLLQGRYGRRCCVFATCTLPQLGDDDMHIVHSNWSKIVELYRLNVRRYLQAAELDGDIVTVSEIQPRRFIRTGQPVLHLHSVFIGKKPGQKGWALATADHDDCWARALRALVHIPDADLFSSCNLQQVKKSAESYLGKYMTKGSSEVVRAIASGYTGWLPKQWWNMSRPLRDRIERETVLCGGYADSLMDCIDEPSVWSWARHVVVESEIGPIWLASYGRLDESVAQMIRLNRPGP